MQLTKQEINETQIIVTTPEKWDVVTRKPTGEGELASVSSSLCRHCCASNVVTTHLYRKLSYSSSMRFTCSMTSAVLSSRLSLLALSGR